MVDYYCYIITNDKNQSYTGCTNNLDRRLKQHNGLLKGGAKYTRKSNNWKYYYIIGIFDKKSAFKFEYQLKFKKNNKGNLTRISGINNKFNRLKCLLTEPEWNNIIYKKI